MNFLKKRLISFFLTAVVVILLLPVLGLSAGAEYVYVPDPVRGQAWISVFNSIVKVLTKSDIDCTYFFTDSLFSHVGECSHMDQLEKQCAFYNESAYKILQGIVNDSVTPAGVILLDENYGIYRIYDTYLDSWAVDLNGEFPWIDSSNVDGDVPAEFVEPTSGKWLRYDSEEERSTQLVVISYDALSSLVLTLNEDFGHACKIVKGYIANDHVQYYYIKDSAYYVYCNSSNMPYASISVLPNL